MRLKQVHLVQNLYALSVKRVKLPSIWQIWFLGIQILTSFMRVRHTIKCLTNLDHGDPDFIQFHVSHIHYQVFDKSGSWGSRSYPVSCESDTLPSIWQIQILGIQILSSFMQVRHTTKYLTNPDPRDPDLIQFQCPCGALHYLFHRQKILLNYFIV